MKCQTCGSLDHRVLRTDDAEDQIARMRECNGCGARFKTAEVPLAVFSKANDIVEAFGVMKRVVGEE